MLHTTKFQGRNPPTLVSELTMKTGVVPPLGNRHWAKPITIGSASVIPLIDKARNLHAHRPAMDLQNTSYRAARSKDPPAHGRSLSSPPWSCRARAAAFRCLDRGRRLFAVLIAVFADTVFSSFSIRLWMPCVGHGSS